MAFQILAGRNTSRGHRVVFSTMNEPMPSIRRQKGKRDFTRKAPPSPCECKSWPETSEAGRQRTT